jgi:hypothetical protein
MSAKPGNAPMIKSWKKAIESLGFVRWHYIKLKHLHCMAFRKVQLERETSLLISEIVGFLTTNPSLIGRREVL